MVDKSLNAALDMHLDQVKSGQTHPEKKKKEKKNSQNSFLKRIKNYLFPSTEFQITDFGAHGTAIVEKIDKGIHYHIKKLKVFWKNKKSAKQMDTQKRKEPEEVDVSKVKEIMRNNKI